VIRVLLVDDHKLVRAGLQSLLESTDDLTVVGAASSGEHAVELVDRLTPDVVLMDLSMPGMGGIEATRRITARYPEVQVLVLTSFSDAERVRGALDAGAVGYLLKDSDPEDLLGGLRAVVAGESPLDSRAARAMLSTARPGAEAELTHREREVLTLVSRGLANKDIARLLTITERTVKAHLSNAFAAIGVADRTSAAVWAQRHLATVD
jgi:DNA-binding NarL/FixJ family response regulator